MRLSTSTDMVFAAYGEEKGIELLANAGFDSLDFSFFDEKYYAKELNKEFFTELKNKAYGLGMTFNQAHAPLDSSFDDDEKTAVRFGEIVQSIKNASYLGVENIVVHPCQHLRYKNDGVPEKLFEMNMDFYNRLKPYSEEYGVKIAVENMWQSFKGKIMHSTCSRPEEFIRYIDELNSDCFVACLDIGHAMVVCEKPDDFIGSLGSKRLKALHIHDVDGTHDSHTLPYFGIVDWDNVTKALAKIGYTGDFTFEIPYFISDKPAELYPSYLKLAADTGRYLISKIQSKD